MNNQSKSFKEFRLQDAKSYAISKGGECLSNVYLDTHSNLLWRCGNPNHEPWYSPFNSTVRGKAWCRSCSQEESTNAMKTLNAFAMAQEYAKERGGQCLSTEYVNTRTNMLWKCANPNHPSWLASYKTVVNGKCWCRFCGYEKAALAPKKERVGRPPRLPPSEYQQKAMDYAQSRGGECLEGFYEKNTTEFVWKCSNPEHDPWTASYRNIVTSKYWCPKCAVEEKRQKFKLQDGLQIANDYAKSKGGSCLSTEYVNKTIKMQWKCANPNHPSWLATFKKVVGKEQWCSACGNEAQGLKKVIPNGLERAKQFALMKDGECLSTEYKNIDSPMLWHCGNTEHEPWSASYYSIVKLGTWCPHCARSTNKGENRVRMFFETYYGVPFPSVKPIWNVGNKGIQPFLLESEKLFLKFKENKTSGSKRLELDGYNEKLKIAFEYDGLQHYDLTWFVKNHNERLKIHSIQRINDYVKDKNCKEQGVVLVRIPQLHGRSATNFFIFIRHVLKFCKEKGLNFKFSLFQIRIMKKKFNQI